MVNVYLGDPNRARALAGHPTDGTGGTNAEVTSQEMDDALNYGHNQLVLFTGKSDWSGSEPIIDQIKRIEEHFAASYIRSWWIDRENKAQELYNRAKDMIRAILDDKSMASANPPDKVGFLSTKYEYKTPALNPKKPRYLSPRTDF
jgi:hypothetical protein